MKLHQAEYKETLPRKGRMGLRYFEYLGVPTLKKDVETIVVRYCSPTRSEHELKTIDLRRIFATISCQWTDTR